ncbi:MAG: hypothetical protein Q9217_000159 [Psora testacea]
MVKPLTFKGDKKVKKRKASHLDEDSDQGVKSSALTVQNAFTETQEDDSWVTAEAATDLTGPIIVVLPSTKPTCIACDANGKVFASEMENVVEKDPLTAEPHDVRQVWIVNRVYGTEQISFKGHHGRYLSCDGNGVLSANREAITPEESFLCVPSLEIPGAFSIQTVREKFLAIADEAKGLRICGDAVAISFHTTLRIRMQARFKPRFKADKEQKVKERISRKELEEVVGRRLEDDEVRRLKKARVQGSYHEAILDVRVKGKHDKYS